MSWKCSLGETPLEGTVLLADVGNSRIKLARLLVAAVESALPVIDHRLDLDSHGFAIDALETWLAAVAPGPATVLIGSVYEAAATRLEASLAEVSATRHRGLRQRRMSYHDLPLAVHTEEPERVGIDRVAGAAAGLVAADGGPVIVVDCGTATSVNMVDQNRCFLGGAILPGPALQARALADGTCRLPEVMTLGQGAPPALPGRSTVAAIAAGIGWGMRGAVHRILVESRQVLGGETPVVLTGGWRGAVRDAIPGAIEVPDLVLAGIALAVAPN
jgi:pantothenate kinase type III